MTMFPNPFRPQHPASDLPTLTTARAGALFLDDRGAATAEYAIATMAAVAFAGLLVVIMRPQPTNCQAAAARRSRMRRQVRASCCMPASERATAWRSW